MDKQYLKKLGQKIEKIRTVKDVSVQDLAYKSRVTPEYIEDVTNGKINVPLVKTMMIIESLDEDVKNFFLELHKEYITENKEHHLFDRNTWTDEKPEIDFKPTIEQKLRTLREPGYDPYIDEIEHGRIDPPITFSIRMMAAMGVDFFTMLNFIK
jgi:transcriptional regulator with XRE-family HTH domain